MIVAVLTLRDGGVEEREVAWLSRLPQLHSTLHQALARIDRETEGRASAIRLEEQ